MSSEPISYAVCCIVSIILLSIPLLWQIRKRNVAAALLVFWLQTALVFSAADAIIWPSLLSIFTGYEGKGYCDFVIKWKVAAEFGGVNASVMCVMITIYRMFYGVGMYRETRRSKRIRVWYEWGIAGVFPLLLAGLHYVVQPSRYYLTPVTGCVPPIDNSWLSLIILAWPLVFSTIALVLVGFILFKLQQHMEERSVMGLLRSTSQLDASFKRLYLLVALFTLIYYPTNLYTFVQFCLNDMLPYDWEAVHADWWDTIYRFPDNSHFQYQRWVKVAASWILFIIFGRGGEATAIYWDLAKLFHVTNQVQTIVRKYQSFTYNFEYIWLPRITPHWMRSKEGLPSTVTSSGEGKETHGKPSLWQRITLFWSKNTITRKKSSIALDSFGVARGPVAQEAPPTLKERVVRRLRRIGRPKIRFEFSITWIRDSLYNANPIFGFSRYRLDVPESPQFCETFDSTTLEKIARQASSQVDAVLRPKTKRSVELERLDTSVSTQVSTLPMYSPLRKQFTEGTIAVDGGARVSSEVEFGKETGMSIDEILAGFRDSTEGRETQGENGGHNDDDDDDERKPSVEV
ncbi:hypothetical protein ABW19_dt0207152 [Dactylella cylindrospora]|nr:hypothetical protein ABW19_dt0207152 [Dactylella cylindrospora]